MSKLIEVKMVSYDPNKGIGKCLDTSEIDDVIVYDLFLPAHFGGQTNPYPKVGEALVIRYNRTPPRIVECFRPQT